MPRIEPSRFGVIPAWGLWARHVRNFSVSHVEFRATNEDLRSTVQLDDVAAVTFDAVKFPHGAGASTFVLKNVSGFAIHNSRDLPETKRDQPIASEKL